MKRATTLFLRAALIIIALGVAVLCAIAIPHIWGEVPSSSSGFSYAIYTIFIGMYVAAVPYFVGVYKAWQLLNLIDKGKAFSGASVKVVQAISICAAIISGIYIVCLPFFYIWAQGSDAPGLVIIGMMLVGVPMIVAVFAALFQRLISEATDIKAENELTV